MGESLKGEAEEALRMEILETRRTIHIKESEREVLKIQASRIYIVVQKLEDGKI